MCMPTGRRIKPAPIVREAVDSLAASSPRFLCFWKSIKWHLKRQPEKGKPMRIADPRHHLYRVFVPSDEGIFPNNGMFPDSVWVFYSYNDEVVCIHAVRINEPTRL